MNITHAISRLSINKKEKSHPNCRSFECDVNKKGAIGANGHEGIKNVLVRLIDRPPHFNLTQPPNPFKLIEPHEIEKHLEQNFNQKFLIFYLNNINNLDGNEDDLSEKCNNLKIQLLASPSSVYELLNTGSNKLAIDSYTTLTKSTVHSINNSVFLSSDGFGRNISVKNELYDIKYLDAGDQSAQRYNIFKPIFFTFSLLFVVFTISFLIYFYWNKSKKRAKKVNKTGSDSNNVNQMMLNHSHLMSSDQYQNLLANETLAYHDHHKGKQYGASTSHQHGDYCYQTLLGQLKDAFQAQHNDSTLHHNGNEFKNYLIKNINNENILLKLNVLPSTCSSIRTNNNTNSNLIYCGNATNAAGGKFSASTTTTTTESTDTSASCASHILKKNVNSNCYLDINKSPNVYNSISFKNSSGLSEKRTNTVKKCSCVKSNSLSSESSASFNCSCIVNSASVLLNNQHNNYQHLSNKIKVYNARPSEMDATLYETKINANSAYSPQSLLGLINNIDHQKLIVNPYEKLLLNSTSGVFFDHINSIGQNSFNIGGQAGQLANCCANCVHLKMSIDTSQHYANDFTSNVDAKCSNDQSEQFYEIIDDDDLHKENEKKKQTTGHTPMKLPIGMNTLNAATKPYLGTARKYPKTNPNYVRVSSILNK